MNVNELPIPDELIPAIEMMRSDPSLENAKKINDLKYSEDAIQTIRAIGAVSIAFSIGALATSYVLITESVNQILSATVSTLFRRTVCSVALGLSASTPLALGVLSGIVGIAAIGAKIKDEAIEPEEAIVIEEIKEEPTDSEDVVEQPSSVESTHPTIEIHVLEERVS